MNSPATAITHLSGKQHKKKLAATRGADFTSQKTDEVSTSSNQVSTRSNQISTSSNQEPLPKKPKYDARCEICKIDFTSGVHAEQHYSGKRHAGMVLKSLVVRMSKMLLALNLLTSRISLVMVERRSNWSVKPAT